MLLYQALMRELELKEKKIKEIQNTGDRLLREDHPARPTVEVRGGVQHQGGDSKGLLCQIGLGVGDHLEL